MKRFVVLLSLLLLGCDKEVERSYEPEYTEERTVSCEYTDFCMDCGLDFSGDFTCGPRLSMSCSGHQQAIVKVKPYKVWYESKQVRRYEDTVIVKTISSCR